ncbi:hypothetical protein HY643_04530 [Candidatus Woesearchaeota archaeon]|nr:hypothetical protein [Candidatus Woesearchaeota archaeon]
MEAKYKLKNFIKIIIASIAILGGLLAIIKIVQQLEIAIGLISITFGVLAIIWVNRARKILSKGSSLKEYAKIFMFALTLTMLFSISEMLEKILLWAGPMLYLKYFFISAAYLVFVFAAYKMLYLSKEFGFGEESKKIAELIKKRRLEKKKK